MADVTQEVLKDFFKLTKNHHLSTLKKSLKTSSPKILKRPESDPPHSFWGSQKSKIQFHADSILELARMIELDNDTTIVSWTKLHGIRIPYMFDGTNHNYIPDFLLQDINGNTILEEVKGRKEPIDIAKEEQAIIYCNNNNYTYRMIMCKDLKDIANYKKLLKETK